MTDIATITAFLGSIKTATELAKAIGRADTSLEKAELKLRIAELLETIADAKMQALEVKDLIEKKDQKIKELTDKLEGRVRLIRKDGLYYEIDDDGQPTGDPFCSHCWEADGRALHLDNWEGMLTCVACGSVRTD